jgi:hypothetical protein
VSGGALFGVLAVWALAGAALAQPAPAVQDLVFGDTPVIGPGPLKASGEVIYTAMERPVLLFHYFSLEPDCRPVAVGIRLVEPPEHGAVSFSKGAEQPSREGKPIYVRDDPRSRCDDRLVATDDASYAPAPGFSGHDRVVVEFTDRDEVFTDTIEVNVVSLKPEKPPRRVRRR